MAWNNADFAVILPDRSVQNQALANQLYERSERRRLEQERQQKEQLQRQDTLTKYVGSEFDDKDFMTGTAADPLINNQLSQTRQKYAQMISKNPDISLADLSFQMQKDLNNINGYSANIKNARAAIMAQTKEFDKTKGIDGQAIQKLALNNFLYNIDPKTGQKTLKSANELDPNQDYVGDVIQKHPEIYLNEGQAMDAALKDYPTVGVGNTLTTAHGGIRRTTEYDGKLYPFQQVLRDKNGAEITDVSGKAQYGLRSQTAMIGNKPVILNGQPLQIMDNDVYSHWVSNPANNAILIKDLNTFNAQQTKSGQPEIQNNTPEADLLKSHFLLQRLQNIPAPDFKHKDKTSEANFLEKQQAGIPLRLSMSPEDRELLKANKENQKLEGADMGVLLRGAALDKSVLEGATPEDVGGKPMYNIANTIGGLKLGYNAKHEPVFAKAVLIDPANPGTITVKDANDNLATYQGKQLRGFIKRVAAHNGSSLDKAEKVLNLHTDANGNFKNLDPDAIMQAKIQQRQEQKKAKSFYDALNPFKK